MAATPRPANGRPPSRLTEGSTLDAVIDAYLAGARDEDRRGLRSAFSHVAAELGTMPVRSVRPRHVAALLDDLSDAGLSPRREAAVVDALHALFAFAFARGLIADDPTPAHRAQPIGASRERESAAQAPTPTVAMLALGARVALLTTWIIVIAFLGLLVALLVEFH